MSHGTMSILIASIFSGWVSIFVLFRFRTEQCIEMFSKIQIVTPVRYFHTPTLRGRISQLAIAKIISFISAGTRVCFQPFSKRTEVTKSPKHSKIPFFCASFGCLRVVYRIFENRHLHESQFQLICVLGCQIECWQDYQL